MYKLEIVKIGIVVIIKVNKFGKIVFLRVDMDVLLIIEESRCIFKLIYDGKMYVCGYDGYIVGFFGVGMILNELKDEFLGIIKLFF